MDGHLQNQRLYMKLVGKSTHNDSISIAWAVSLVQLPCIGRVTPLASHDCFDPQARTDVEPSSPRNLLAYLNREHE